MCNEFKSKKDFSFSFLSLSIGFFRFALSFSNRNLTEIYTELELKNSATYSLEGHAQTHLTLMLQVDFQSWWLYRSLYLA